MIITFTSELKHTAKELKNEALLLANRGKEPSEFIIQNILNYSKNLEVKKTRLIPFVEFLKS